MQIGLREKFLRVYANIPMNMRDDIILTLDDGRTVSWDVAFFEVKQDTKYGEEILEGLKKLDLI